MRIWGRVALGGIAVLTSSFVITIPAGAAQSHPGGVSDTCPEVLAGAPTGGVEKVTDPADGSEVRRGAVVAVTLRWDTTTFTSPVLHKALDCVTVDGALADQLGIQERDTANDGSFETHFTVPGDLVDGTRLCDRGFVSGPGHDNRFDREKSNDVCFTVQGDTPTKVPAPTETPPAFGAPAPSATAAPSGTADVAPGPGPLPASSFISPVDSATPIPAPVGVGPAGRGTPGTGVGPDATVLGERDILPRTGSAVEGPVRRATLALLLGGICLLASWRPGRSTGSESRLPMNVQPNPDRGRPPAAAGGSAGGGHLGEGPRGLIAGESRVDSE